MANNEWYNIYKNPEKYIKEKLVKEGLLTDDIIYLMDIVGVRISQCRYKALENNSNTLQGVTSRDIETALLLRSNNCFADVPSLGGWIFCTYVNQGSLDFNRHPIDVRLIAHNGESIPNTYKFKDIIPIYDNNLNIPRITVLWEYIRKMKQLDDDVLKLCSIACLPAVIVGDKKQASALKAVATKLGIKDPFITGDGTLVSQVQTFDIKLPISPLDIYDLKTKYKNECLSSMGIYNVEQKRERIVTQELVNQNDYSDVAYNSSIILRKEAVLRLKEVSGIDLQFQELYDYNQAENLKEETKKTYDLAKAEAKGTKDGNPNANKGGMFNG